MITIDKGVPIPGKNGRPSGVHQYDEIPWEQMQIGDSVYIKRKSAGGIKNRAKAHGFSVLIRRENEIGLNANGEPVYEGFRVWRIS